MSLDPRDIARLSSYMDGTLSPAERAEVEAWLARDAAARSYLEDLRRLQRGLKDVPRLTPPEAFYTRVMRDIDTPPRRRPFWSFAPFKLAGTLAAAALVVWVTHDQWRTPGRGRPAAPPSPIQMFQDRLGAQQAFESRRARMDDEGDFDMKLSSQVKNESKGARTADQAPAEKSRPGKLLRKKSDRPAEVVVTAPGASFHAKEGLLRDLAKAKPAAAPPPAPAAPPVLEEEAVPDQPQVAGAALALGGERAEAAVGGVAASRESVIRLSEAPAGKSAHAAALEWQGDQSGIRAPRTAVARDARAWSALWRSHAGNAPVPPVDFARQQVVAVFAGEKPTAGHAVAISALRPAGDALVVHYRETAAEGFAAQVLTAPFHIRVVAKTTGDVRFQKDR